MRLAGKWKVVSVCCLLFAALGCKKSALPVEQAVTLAKNGEVTKAIALLNQIVKADPTDAWAYNCRGTCYAQLEDFEAASRDFNRAIELCPTNSLFLRNRGLLAGRRGSPTRALKDFSLATSYDPHDYFSWIGKAIAFEHMGLWESALTNAARAAQLNPKEPTGLAHLAHAQFVTGAWREASANYSAALLLSPNDAEILNGSAWFLATCPDASLRNGKLALQHAKRACALAGWTNSVFLDTVAAAFAEVGDFARAEEYQTRATKLLPEGSAGALASRKAGECFRRGQPNHEGDSALYHNAFP